MNPAAANHYRVANTVLRQLKTGLDDGNMTPNDALFITVLAVAQSMQGLLALALDHGEPDGQAQEAGGSLPE